MKIFEQIIKIINNSNFLSLLSIVVASTTSYFVAKYNASKSNIIKVKQLQLDNVYLPLFRLFEALPEHMTIDYAIYLHEQTSVILDLYYELVFPQLHDLNRKLENQITQKDDSYKETILDMRHQITIDYELLKKSLGYPSESLYKLFIRTPKKRKKFLVIIIFSTLAVILNSILLLYRSIFINNTKIFELTNIFTVFTMILYINLATSQIKKYLKG